MVFSSVYQGAEIMNIFKKVIGFVPKILRRCELLIESLPAIIKALFLEPRRHPWRLILDLFILPFNKQFRRVTNYLNKYYWIKEIPKNPSMILVDFGEIKIAVQKSLFNNQIKLIGLLSMYFELLYPYLVKEPIPVLMSGGAYEKGPVFLENGDTVIDIGANVGIFTFWASQKVGEKGKVFAFEPMPEVAQVISDSLEFNLYGGINVEVVSCALGQSNGTLNLNFLPDNLGGKGGDARKIPNSSSIEVKQIALDEFVEKRCLNKVDFIKMDIEGMEREALKGASKTIAKFKPKMAICIYHLPDDPEVIPQIIKNICPDYQFIKTKAKLFAWCPNRNL